VALWSHAGGSRIAHRLINYIDERAAHAYRWITPSVTGPAICASRGGCEIRSRPPTCWQVCASFDQPPRSWSSPTWDITRRSSSRRRSPARSQRWFLVSGGPKPAAEWEIGERAAGSRPGRLARRATGASHTGLVRRDRARARGASVCAVARRRGGGAFDGPRRRDPRADRYRIAHEALVAAAGALGRSPSVAYETAVGSEADAIATAAAHGRADVIVLPWRRPRRLVRGRKPFWTSAYASAGRGRS